MSRSIWKGPFNQNIDKREKRLSPMAQKPYKARQNLSKNYELPCAKQQDALEARHGALALQGPSLRPAIGSKGSFNHQPPTLPPALRRKKEVKPGEKKQVWSRSSMILPQYVGRSFFIYNGKTFISIQISPKMLGHKFGEFASTRQKPIHKKKK